MIKKEEKKVRMPSRKLLPFFLMTVLFFYGNLPTAHALNPRLDPINIEASPSLTSLVHQSDVIALGTLDTPIHAYPLGKRVDTGELVNYAQFLTIKTLWKGQPPTKIMVLTTGVKPLPDAKSPLNLKYPGALTEGDYVLFLKNVPGTPFYQFTTGMQSVYPLISGRTITLKDAGFATLDQLTLHQLGTKLRYYLVNRL
jgi:hypothetical protein